MIIKFVEADDPHQALALLDYIDDEKTAAPGDEFGEKVIGHGAANCFGETSKEIKAELHADDCAYSGQGRGVIHVIVSWQEGENPTNAQVDEFWNAFLVDQGLSGHKGAWRTHGNTGNIHSHGAFLRIQPEPDAKGNYKLQCHGGRETWKNGTTDMYKSARATVIDFAAKHGFAADFEEVAPLRDPDAIELTQSQQAQKAQHGGQKLPIELMGEKARDIIRAAGSWDELHKGLIAEGISFRIEDNNNPEKYRQWGVLKGPEGERIPLVKLPKDCRLYALEKRFGEQGRESGEAPKTEASKAFYAGKLSAGKAKTEARKILSGATTFAEAEKALADRGMRIERQGKAGAYLIYGEGEGQKMKLSALGGKYSLNALSKKYADSDHILSSKHASSIPSSNASVKKDARESVSAHASERASAAQDRADAAEARADGIAPSGGEGVGDGFYELDFIEQIRVMMSVAGAQTAAHVAIMRAMSQAREAEQKALEAEARAQAAGMASETRQHLEITHKHEATDMFDTFKKKAQAPNTEIARQLREYAVAMLDMNLDVAAQRFGEMSVALGRPDPQFRLRDDAPLGLCADIADRAMKLADIADRFSDPVDGIAPVLGILHIQAEEIFVSETPWQLRVAEQARAYADAIREEKLDIAAERLTEIGGTPFRVREDADLGWTAESAYRASYLADALEYAYEHDPNSECEQSFHKFWREAGEMFTSEPSTTIDKSSAKSSGTGVGKAPAQTGLKIEKPAQAAQEQEKPRRKFSFGGGIGKMFGGGKASAPTTGPKE